VFVSGFDFGTTDEQFEGHMGGAGTIQKVHWFNKGAAEVTFSSEAEANAAVEQFNGTTIEGKSRPMQVSMQSDKAKKDSKKRKKGSGKGKDSGSGKGGKMQMMLELMSAWYGGEDDAPAGKKRKGNAGGAVQVLDVPAKSKLVHGLALLLGRPPTKADMTWTVEQEGGKHVGTVSLPSMDKTFTGEPADSKKGAENLAAEAGLAALAGEIATAEAEHKEKKDNKNKESLAKLKAAQEAKKAAKAPATEA